MGIFDIFKKEQEIAISRPQSPSIEKAVDNVLQQTEKEIVKGLTNPIASTGTPIDELHGAAKSIAQISNIGGGSIATGGGGMKKGFETVTKNAQAKAIKNILEKTKEKKIEE